MKLRLKVLDSGLPKIPISDRLSINLIDDRWNTEVTFEIPEKLILTLIEDIIDNIDGDLFDYMNPKKSPLKNHFNANRINNIMNSTRSWKKIHILISDEGFYTSRFTRISLFNNLLNIPKMVDNINEKIQNIKTSSNF